MKPSRIAMATVGVGAALAAGVWTLRAAAVPLPADPIAIPVVATLQPTLADPGTADPARVLAAAEARLFAMNGQLQAMAVPRRPLAVPTAPARTDATAPGAAAAPPTHSVTGASGATSADGDDAHADEHHSENQDD